MTNNKTHEARLSRNGIYQMTLTSRLHWEKGEAQQPCREKPFPVPGWLFQGRTSAAFTGYNTVGSLLIPGGTGLELIHQNYYLSLAILYQCNQHTELTFYFLNSSPSVIISKHMICDDSFADYFLPEYDTSPSFQLLFPYHQIIDHYTNIT